MSEVKTEQLQEQEGEIDLDELKKLLGVNCDIDPSAHDRFELNFPEYRELTENLSDAVSQSTAIFLLDVMAVYSTAMTIGMSRQEAYELLITKLTFDHNIKVSELSVEMAKEQSKAIQIAQDKETI